MSPSKVTNGSGSTHEQLRHIPLSYDNECSEKSALDLVFALRPAWQHAEGPIEIIRFKDGITNTLLKVVKKIPGKSVEQIDDEAILLRAYGNNTDILIDRDREAQSHALLAELGLAPPLLARFNNGLLYNFIQGQVCTPQDLIKDEVWRAVARRLAEWHSVPLPESYFSEHQANGINGGYTNGHGAAGDIPRSKPVPNIWTVMQKWINALPTATEAEQSQKAQLQAELGYSSQALDVENSAGDHGMIFGHCDILSANVIIVSGSGSINGDNGDKATTVRFIDYEYATACPAAFDIANHFAEWGGYDCDYNMLPNRTKRRSFLEEYLRIQRRLQKGKQWEDGVFEALFKQVDDFRGIPGLYWGIWALIQATISQIDFDYASYAKVRLGEYFAWQEEREGIRKKGGSEMPLRERVWVT